ncbi:amidase signature enzyme [Schizopora paradoxa]|uniref:amidase n=1 Tax=Schizopora paradoxa TaxID=27342 RepID=A0A0H2S8Y7_9AGAM|nr:amidase signature enzyme [Schizopora paradoxa]
MSYLLSYFQHKRDCRWKQDQRKKQITSLPSDYFTTPTTTDLSIYQFSLAELQTKCTTGNLTRLEILLAYGKKAILAHVSTNCLAEVMIADAAKKPTTSEAAEHGYPLDGIPVSIKDSELAEGYDATISFSAWVNKPSKKDSTIVRILRDAGAIVHAKTSVPTTFLSCETRSDLFGRTVNPYNPKYASGGSTGGGASLLAYGGTVIEIGTDLAGSVRCPAHYTGIYTIKGTNGRFPSPGGVSSIIGLEAVNLIAAPMSRNLNDLEEFWKRMLKMQPWNYDPTVVPLPWRENILEGKKKLRWGVMWEDGIAPPSPACKRALQMVVDALKSNGYYEVVDFVPPSPLESLSVGSQLIFADGGKQLVSNVRLGETLDPGVNQVEYTLGLPRFIKKAYAWVLRNIYGDHVWAELVEHFHEKTVGEQWLLVARRDAYRSKWHEAWKEAGLDFLLTVPSATPAIPEWGMKSATVACASYVFLFNVLDYAAGVLPITTVDRLKDALPSNFRKDVYPKMNTVAKGCYENYDAKDMEGLPVGVQVVGKRFEEEKVLEGMKIIEAALKSKGQVFKKGVF